MKTNLFDFDLPEGAIALRPAVPRDSARLLQIGGDGLLDHHVFDLPDLLQRGDVLVLNETRVLPAALQGVRAARAIGGGGDVTLDINLLTDKEQGVWTVFARPAKRLKRGDRVTFSGTLNAVVIEKCDGGEIVLQFSQRDEAFLEAIKRVGVPPLPPYIARKRAADASDFDDYQTIYAQKSGSVAAPTAGLHFTPEIFSKFATKGVQIERLTLHVGAGTFLPVKSDDTKNHHMHSEWFSIDRETADRINMAKLEGRRIIAVGTTALRALEASAEGGRVKAGSRDTDIFITPGYSFQIIDGLMTNFHLPKSTLFMLVSALAGLDRMQSAYRYALETGYRFYSYGDSSLIWIANS